MLLLTTREGEAITLTLSNGDKIKVILAKQNGNQARIGIEAPDEILIERDDLILSREMDS